MKVHVVYMHHEGQEGFDLFGPEVYRDAEKANARIKELADACYRGIGDPDDMDVDDAIVLEYNVIE